MTRHAHPAWHDRLLLVAQLVTFLGLIVVVVAAMSIGVAP